MFWFEFAELLLGDLFAFAYETLLQADQTGERKQNGIGLV
jgi:hypothetical protein